MCAVFVLTSLVLRTNLRGRAFLLPVLQVRRRALLFSHSAVSDSLQPHELQHARLPCPSLSPRACSNSCPLSWWCYPTISSSVIPFSSCPQSLLASVFSNESTLCMRWPKSLQSCSTLFDSMDCATCQAPLSMDSPSKNTGVGCHFLFQRIFPTQGSNPRLLCFLHYRQILYLVSRQGSPGISLVLTI